MADTHPDLFKGALPGDLSGHRPVYYGAQRQLEYDFVLQPGADPERIVLTVEGQTGMEIDPEGNVVLHIEGRSIRQRKPAIYQDIDGTRREIAGRYVFRGPYEVGFKIAAYDNSRTLVIDPVLSYSTYLGGAITDEGGGIAVDADGNAYVTGRTSDTRLIWCEAEICEERDVTGAVVRAAFTFGEQAAGTARFFATDHLGSVTDLTDSSGVRIARYSYDPWGRRNLAEGQI